MPDFLKLFDASGRKPRSTQTEFLTWLADNWRHQTFAAQLPVGVGKSACARAIQLMTGGHVITPSNILVDQYSGDYPKANFLKGKANYGCHSSGISCQEVETILEDQPCNGCVYQACKTKALTESTFFNPMSLYYFIKQTPKFDKPSVLIVDEAHQLSSMLLMLSGVRLRKGQYHFSSNVINERFLVQWLDLQLANLYKLRRMYQKQKDVKRLKEIAKEIEPLKLTAECFIHDPQNYAVWIEDGYHYGRPEKFLNLKPLQVPNNIRTQLLNSKRLVLMSGTLFETDIKALVGESTPYQFIDLPSPIPVKNRQILFRPAEFKVNAKTDPREVVKLIENTIKDNEVNGRYPNTIIHVSYATSERLRTLFSYPIIYNDQTNKDARVDEFKRNGGIFLAAGCAEGLDLKHGYCRLNIIPQLLFPNLGDPVVQKRKALQDGEKWYATETMKVVIQQAGRSTRAEDDYSKTVILDPNFAWCYKTVKDYLPKSFKEAVVWGK